MRCVGPGAGINRDQFPPVRGDDEVVLCEFETGQDIHHARHDFADAAWRERVSRGGIFRKRGGERGGLGLGVEATERLITPRGIVLASLAVQGCQVEVHLAQPSRVRGLVGMREAPGQILHPNAALTKEAWQLCPHYA